MALIKSDLSLLNQKRHLNIIKFIMKKFSLYFYRKEQLKLTYFRLKHPLQCYQQTSDSPILSISLFLINSFPTMRPPSLSKQLYSQGINRVDRSKPDYMQSYHPFEQVWSNYLIEQVIEDNAVAYQYTLYVGIPLPDQVDTSLFHNQFIAANLQISNQNQRQICRMIFGLPQIQKDNKKIGIVAYGPPQKNPFEVKINSIGLFVGHLYNNQSWTIFRLGQEIQVPSCQEFMKFSCIILPGSLYSVLSLPAHVKAMMNNLMKAYKLNPSIKILGLCFGHQILAQYFGSKVRKLQRIGGLEKVVFNKDLIPKNHTFEPIIKRGQLSLSEHHEDFVMNLPQKGFKLLASSKSCQIQSFISDDGRIFACQFHGQYFCYFTKRFQKRMYSFHGYALNKFYVKENSIFEKINKEDSRIMLQVYRRFIGE